MKIVKNLKKVGTQVLELPGYTLEIPVFKDAGGNTLADHLGDFKEDTWKILVDKDGMVRGYTKDPSSFGLFEDDGDTNTIVEIDESKLPKAFFDQRTFTMWSWSQKKGVFRRELPDGENEEMNKAIKKDIIDKIEYILTPLQLAEKYGDQTEGEKERQISLEKMLISVGRINPKDRDIVWPTVE